MLLNRTQNKIALSFAVVASTLMILITAVTMVLVNRVIDKNAEELLESNLKTVVSGYLEDDLEEVAVSFQTSNRLSEEYLETKKLPNISEQKAQFNSELEQFVEEQEETAEEAGELLDYASDDAEESEEESMEISSAPQMTGGVEAIAEKESAAKIDLDNANIIIDDPEYDPLSENRQVFSRIILDNGDILFTSDLFDTYFIDPDMIGFQKHVFDQTCVYSYTAKIEGGSKYGTSVQVGQYCSFTPQEQKRLFLQMLILTILLSFTTYFVGIFIARWLLKPMKKSIDQTRKFVQNCHHELLTPITVAITTIAASKKSQDFKKGIHSVEEDLNHAYEALKLLSAKALYDQARITFQKLDLVPILKKAIIDCQKSHPRPDLSLQFEIENSKIEKAAEPTSLKLIFQNLICNSLKYSNSNGKISIHLTPKKLTIENTVHNTENIDPKKIFDLNYRGPNGEHIEGSGIGLSIVKELTKIHDWKIQFRKTEYTIQAVITF